VLIVCCDGLTGLPEAIEATWKQATVQTRTVHLIRAAMRFVNYKDRKAVAQALKPIYTAADADAARVEFEAFRDSTLGQKYPHAVADLGSSMGTVHPVPGVPTRAASATRTRSSR
jgi:putative transposase